MAGAMHARIGRLTATDVKQRTGVAPSVLLRAISAASRYVVLGKSTRLLYILALPEIVSTEMQTGDCPNGGATRPRSRHESLPASSEGRFGCWNISRGTTHLCVACVPKEEAQWRRARGHRTELPAAPAAGLRPATRHPAGRQARPAGRPTDEGGRPFESRRASGVLPHG